jgi:trehalose synthase
MAAAREVGPVLGGRTIWNINSTARGGGVAEMLKSLIAYARGAGLDARWLVIPGNPDFFAITKRIHNYLHGSTGDGEALDGEAREIYESALGSTAEGLTAKVAPGDVVVLHDPQTAGLVPAMREAGAHVVWRCHVGIDTANDTARLAWRFLLPYVTPADAYVFSRASFAWEGLDRSRIFVIPPSIDAFSPKNADMDAAHVQSILSTAGIVGGKPLVPANFTRLDGRTGTVFHRAEMVEVAPATLDDSLVVQISRWDRLKDPLGVMQGFVDHVAPMTAAHLMLAGPAAAAVADDPEGLQVLADCVQSWEQLPEPARGRVHLAALPMTDSDENAAMVNALQRHATVVIQKSLAEGFGLTVAEAMWKGRPVVASRIGGIQEQIDDGRTGLLVNDPRDLADYGGKVRQLLEKPFWAAAIGAAARENVRDHFLAPRHLLQYAALLKTLVIRSAA